MVVGAAGARGGAFLVGGSGGAGRGAAALTPEGPPAGLLDRGRLAVVWPAAAAAGASPSNRSGRRGGGRVVAGSGEADGAADAASAAAAAGAAGGLHGAPAAVLMVAATAAMAAAAADAARSARDVEEGAVGNGQTGLGRKAGLAGAAAFAGAAPNHEGTGTSADASFPRGVLGGAGAVGVWVGRGERGATL